MQGAACCVSGTCRSATAMLACLLTGTSFSATRNVTVPGPCPSVDDVKATQLTGLAATHEHSRSTVMFNVPLPPEAA